jgi:hypothetical protein
VQESVLERAEIKQELKTAGRCPSLEYFFTLTDNYLEEGLSPC